MKSIDADIKSGNFKNIYFLIGVEPYLIDQYSARLVNALSGGDDGLNLRRYSGAIPDMNELIEYADTVPFFSNRRVIVLKDTGVFKSSDDRLALYIKNMPETTYLIFTECYAGDRRDEKKYEKSLVDKRYKLYKTVQESGRIIEFKRLDEDTISKWLLKKFTDSGLNVTRNAMDCLLDYAGNDMTRLSNEAEKLICYRMGHSSVGVDDVKAICSKNIENDAFEMVSAIASKNKGKALKLYYALVELAVRPMNILSLIEREFNLLMRIKALKDDRTSQEEMVKLTGINKYYVSRYIAVSGRFTGEYLRKAVTDCVETENLIKQGRLPDVVGVEMLIVKYTV
ncbi:MAG: DNA polymerase III subunit delta [Lachnospiraceae bacterium]|nr:DNA polymerase III subunit delta [Lachnospiraceae bacterium]